jgi:hypothetical protein
VTAVGERCSTIARALAEPLAGTAPLARTWVALEQPGPWGPKVLTDSHLDPQLGKELTSRTEDTGVSVVLVRRPGHHADTRPSRVPGREASSAATAPPAPTVLPARAVWIGHTGADAWLVRATVTDPAALLDLDFAALAAGTRPRLGDADHERLLLVCTNSRRDECCALMGRPLAQQLAASRPGRVWESSHLGGHRLGPVVLSLPDGFVYGGPAASGLSLASCRGRSTLPRPAQAAELAALADSADPTPRPMAVEADGSGWLVTDPADPTFTTRYTVTETTQDPPRKESCRKTPVSSLTYTAVRIGP